MLSPFDAALAFVLRWEGGLVDDPADPGGLTNHGISQRAYPDLNIRALTPQEIAQIYLRDYWVATRCPEMPAPLALMVFDSAVNQGARRAAEFLQQAAGVRVDGVLGPRTMEAAQRVWTADPAKTLRELAARRMAHYATRPHWHRFGLGWTRRLFDALQTASALVAFHVAAD